MAKKVVITIARQLGSGGSYIGQQVARRLGYAYIDRQILQLAAKELDVEESEIENRDGRLQTFWEKLLAGFTLGAPFYTSYTPPPCWVSDDKLAAVAGRLIVELAAKGHA